MFPGVEDRSQASIALATVILEQGRGGEDERKRIWGERKRRENERKRKQQRRSERGRVERDG